MIRLFLFVIGSILLTTCNNDPQPPAPFGALPSPRQIQWHQMEYYMFIHFGPNTFTDKEWGHGDEDPEIFNPSQLDCRQWVRIAKMAGMKAIIITAKHHDGFCLWQSKYSTHTVRESAWKNGTGDILQDLSEACREYGLKFGVYVSPWDRNHPAYGTDEYNQIFAGTLKEVLGNYGEIFEQWFDGANGEGANGKKQEYQWEMFRDVVREMQPKALIFGGPCREIRWVGNESGYADETNWATLTTDNSMIDGADNHVLETGMENGREWLPAEVDVSIRPGWFYSASTDDKVKSLAELLDIYYSSVGRNGNLLLNVPPDRRGLIHHIDSTRLMELRMALDETFAVNLAKNAKITADNTRGGSSKFGVQNLLDRKFDTYWAADDNILAATIEIDIQHKQPFNRIVLQEYIPLGQRIKIFSIEYMDGEKWKQIDRQTTIGYKRILCFPTITAQKIRIKIEKSLACPVLNEIGVYKAPELPNKAKIIRNRKGEVSIFCETGNPVIRYTVDGSEPDILSTIYVAPFELPRGGTVKAKTFVDSDAKIGETVVETFDLATVKWKILSSKKCDSYEEEKAIDGDPHSIYVLPDKQTSISVNLGEELSISGFTYTPVKNATGNVYRYSLYVSTDGKQWNKIKDNSSFDNIKNNPVKQTVRFEQSVTAAFIRVESLETVEAGVRVCIGEIGAIAD